MKSNWSIFFGIVLIITTFFVYACNKADKDLFASGALSGRSEDQLRRLMTGRWKLHYTVNVNRINQCNECYWDFTINDTFTQIYNGNVYSKEKITYSKPSFSPDKWIILPSLDILDSLRADTLISFFQPTVSKSFLTKQ